MDKRTTIIIDSELLAKLKLYCIANKITIKEAVKKAIKNLIES